MTVPKSIRRISTENTSIDCTAWKVSQYGVFSVPYFPVFGLNTEIFSTFSVRIQANTNQKKLRIWKLFTQCRFFVNFCWFSYYLSNRLSFVRGIFFIRKYFSWCTHLCMSLFPSVHLSSNLSFFPSCDLGNRIFFLSTHLSLD